MKRLTGEKKRFLKETAQAYAFLLPSFIILGIFTFWPIGYSLVLSFFNWNFATMRNPYFHGWANYAELFRVQTPLSYSFSVGLAYSFLYTALALWASQWIRMLLSSVQHPQRHINLNRLRKLGITLAITLSFLIGVFFSRMQHIPGIWIVGCVSVFGMILMKKRFTSPFSSNLWFSLLCVVGLYSLMRHLSGVPYELFDFLVMTKEASLFIKAIYNTLYYVVLTTPTGIVISLGIALLLNLPIQGKPFFRTAFFIPYVTSVVAISLVWQWIFNDSFGLMNYVITLFGGNPVRWLTDERWTIPTVAIISVWKSVGYNAIIFLAGLQSIDKFYYEAAEVDGAKSIQKFRHITWPLLSPTTFFVLIVSVISNFKVFTEIFVLYNQVPGPYNNSGMTMVYYIFNQFYAAQQMGKASAAAYILFMIILVLTFFQFRVGRQKVQYVG